MYMILYEVNNNLSVLEGIFHTRITLDVSVAMHQLQHGHQVYKLDIGKRIKEIKADYTEIMEES